MRKACSVLFATACGFFAATGLSADPAPKRIDFNRDVRPVLSKLCFSCHGFDEKSRKGGLRLDLAEATLENADSGQPAILPGKPDDSELIRRLTSRDESERMPPPETGKTVSAEQIELLRLWIAEGAEYRPHWAFLKPEKVLPPVVRNKNRVRNQIDGFVLERLEKEGLEPGEEATPERLLRRVSLDLIGLPPTDEELTQHLELTRIDPDLAYERAVDRLLHSPHFGERMAIDWLDAARYADTNGYFGDRPRQAWPWRDWVIDAFNANMPFDRFTIEQLAGDLLPEPTREQRIATGFHRNSMANNETGIIDEEYRVEAVADRVETTSNVWLGMTLGCAQCHDHKYDPVTQREYYQLFAYFNNSVEQGLVTNDSPPPTIEVPTPKQAAELQHAQQEFTRQEQVFKQASIHLDDQLESWKQTALERLPQTPSNPLMTYDFDSRDLPAKAIGTSIKNELGIRGQAGKFDATQHVELATPFDLDAPWTVSLWFNPETSLGCLWSKIEPSDRRRGVEVLWQKGKIAVNLVRQWGIDQISAVTTEKLPLLKWQHLLISYDGSGRATGLSLWIGGKQAQLSIGSDSLSGSIQSDEPLRIGRRDSGLGFYGLLDQLAVWQRVMTVGEGGEQYDLERLRGALERTPQMRTAGDLTYLKEYYIGHLASETIKIEYETLQTALNRVTDAKSAIPTSLVMEDRKDLRKTHLLIRGQYDHPGEEVSPGVPKILPPLPANSSGNRLELARWLVSPEHPLTSRVMANRLWSICFGEGLVRTPNDFGSQGELPTHPELLDYLALEFVESGWDVKALLRQIVMSATYRQASHAGPELLSRDPENRLLARGPRFRLAAELLRDHALASAGLLSEKIGGPGVKPYQPDGLWEEVSFNEDDSYLQNTDDGLWRRSLYTYCKRQAPPPALLTFDSGTREKCVVRRSRTNTPLQSLVMMNDPTWIEAARALAERCIREGDSDRERLAMMFRRIVTREPNEAEFLLLLPFVARERARFRNHSEEARDLLGVGAAKRDGTIDPNEAAAWTVVAHTVLNLDEVVTRR